MNINIKGNRVLRFGLLFAGLALFFGIFSANSINAQGGGGGPLGQTLKLMDDYNKALSSLKADITMVKTNSQLGDSDTTSGNTNYLPKTAKHKMYVRIDWTKPVEESIVIIGDDYKLYRPKLGQAYIGKTSSAKGSAGNALAFMGMSRAELRANYDVVFVGKEAISGGTQTIHLQLTPKMKTSYKSADVWINSDGLPQQAKITEKNNDTTTVLLSGVKTNVKMEAAIFDLNYPKGTKEIKG